MDPEIVDAIERIKAAERPHLRYIELNTVSFFSTAVKNNPDSPFLSNYAQEGRLEP
jgi:hypothetical protein